MTNKIPKKNLVPFQIFNFGNGKSIHLRKFYDELIKQIGKKAKTKFLNIQKGDIHKTLSVNLKAKKILGWTPKTSIHKGIELTINWFKKNISNEIFL